jgi:hypothetical protein
VELSTAKEVGVDFLDRFGPIVEKVAAIGSGK